MTIDCYTSAGILDHNDDSFMAVECIGGSGCLHLGLNGKMTSDEMQFDCDDFVLCVVSDGVGSSIRGGEASVIAVSELLYEVEHIVGSANPRDMIIETVSSISNTIMKNLDSMGKATLVGYLQTGGIGYLFNTGDSIAEASHGRWRYRSSEHNVLNTRGCSDDGWDARKLTEYMGKSNPRVDVDISMACDNVVLYSDGASPLSPLLDSDGSCMELVRKAVDAGSDDNVTIVRFVNPV